MKLKKLTAFVLGVITAVFAAVALLAALVDSMSTSQTLMQFQMETWAPLDTTGLPAEEYAGMAEMITQYLAGAQDGFQYCLTDEDGTEILLFHDYEQSHMEDCRALYQLDRRILLFSLLACLFTSAGLWWIRCRRERLLGLLTGGGIILLVCVTLTVWGCIDFVSLFILFHQTAFSNMLWILNPQTDMLIRLMPTNFFISYAAIIAGTWLAILTAGEAAGWILLKRQKQNKRRTML